MVFLLQVLSSQSIQSKTSVTIPILPIVSPNFTVSGSYNFGITEVITKSESVFVVNTSKIYFSL